MSEKECCNTCRLNKFDYSQGGCIHTDYDGYACLAFPSENEMIHMVGHNPELLKAWNIYMDVEHDYCFRSRPSGFIGEDLHQEPCEKFDEKLGECGGKK